MFNFSVLAKLLPIKGGVGFGVLLLGVLILILTFHSPGQAATSQPEGIVAVAPDAPFRVLAEEISSETGYRLLNSPVEALKLNPVFLIWVVDPSTASDTDFVAYGQAVRDHQSTVSMGIITGGTLSKARALWKRRNEVSARRKAVINGEYPAASVFQGHIITWPEGQRATGPLSLKSMQEILKISDYVTFSGHSTPFGLRLNPSTKLLANDVPVLPPLVVGTSSCNSLRFWKSGSISLAFIDQGAAAYAGFVYSPNEGYLMGAYENMPFLHTWPEFPIGHVVQVLNRACRQAFAAIPYYHMLGDPRMALSKQAPYKTAEDKKTDDRRRILGRDAPAGIIPVRVPRGATYQYVHIPGVTKASTQDWLYNARLQMTDLGEDKFILFLHRGGDFVIELHRKAPAMWRLTDTVLDSMDQNLIGSSHNSGDVIHCFVGVIIVTCVGWRYRQVNRRMWIASILIGLSSTLILLSYAILRQDDITITSKPTAISWLALSGSFMQVTGGSLFYMNARKWTGRIIGLLLTCFIYFLSTLVIAMLIMNIRIRFSQRLDSVIWNYKMVLPNIVTVLVLFALSLVCFEAFRRLFASVLSPPEQKGI